MKTVYLTIDDSPTEDFLDKVNYLYDRGIPAVFFCEGQKLLNHQAAVIEAIKKGFVIGNHSMNHDYFSDLTLDQGKASIRVTDQIIDRLYQEAGHVRPGKYFRFPHFDQGGAKSGKAYEEKFSQPIETWTHHEDASKMQNLQTYLGALGYEQMPVEGLKMDYYHDKDLLNYVDVRCTFDQWEFQLGDPQAPYGLDKEEAILNRLEEDEPYMGRALNRLDTSDIILIHDMVHTSHLFYKIIDAYIDKGFTFKL